MKETLARLTNKQNQNKKGAKYRKEKREAVQEKMNAEANAERKDSKTLKLTEFVTVSELATMMDVSVNKVIGTLMSVGIMVSINQRLDAETINLVAEECGFKTEYVSAEVQEAVSEEEDDENDLVPRSPIVTVMGHVDMVKQVFSTIFATPMSSQVRLVESHNISERTTFSLKMDAVSHSLILQVTKHLQRCVHVEHR